MRFVEPCSLAQNFLSQTDGLVRSGSGSREPDCGSFCKRSVPVPGRYPNRRFGLQHRSLPAVLFGLYPLSDLNKGTAQIARNTHLDVGVTGRTHILNYFQCLDPVVMGMSDVVQGLISITQPTQGFRVDVSRLPVQLT